MKHILKGEGFSVTVDVADARKLFDEMVENTKKYLGKYFE